MNLKSLILALLVLIAFACVQKKSPALFEFSLSYPDELQQLHKNTITNFLEEEIEAEELNDFYSNLQEDGTWPDIGRRGFI